MDVEKKLFEKKLFEMKNTIEELMKMIEKLQVKPMISKEDEAGEYEYFCELYAHR